MKFHSSRSSLSLSILLITAATLSHTLSLTSLTAEDRIFRAGAAMADITPPLGEMVVGGFAPFPATAIHDKLYAKCLVLDDGETQVAVVICDNLGIVRQVYDDARKMIAEETKLSPDNIVMAATHTHSGTRSSTERYAPLLARGIADAVRNAYTNLEPARIGWGGVDEPSELFNRRWYVSDKAMLQNPFGGIDKVRMNPPRGSAALIEPAGPVDPEVSFVSVQSIDGRPIALLGNYSLHYVGGVDGGDISADYFGIFSRRIGELLDAGASDRPFVGMMSNGTSGDVNNINFRARDGKSYKHYEKMAEVAEVVAQRVKQAHDQIEFRNWVPLKSARRELTLKFRKPDEAMQKYFASVLAKPEGAEKYHHYETNYAERVQKLLDGPDEVSIPLQAVRIGDLAIAAIPFEVFTEIGLEIKEKSPFKDTFTIELANDYHGYLPTPRQHELGGYETWMGTNRVQLDASEQITKVVLELTSELK